MSTSTTPLASPEPAARSAGVLQVHLEELGQHSWVNALFSTFASLYGSAQFRFVARAAGVPDDPCRHVAVSATFPVMRWADLDDQVEPNTWVDLARERLEELDRDLVAQGWRRRGDRGRHWWSLRYDRTDERQQL
jgi:hypothetical protein